MNTPSLNKILDIVKDASGLMKTDTFEISQKEGFANIVTSSDVAVQDFLCSKLKQLVPGSGFLCEEEDMWDTTHEYTWIIDPIDGTANYSRGIAQCAICVGLKHNDDMVIGVVYIPMAGEMFYAEKEKELFLMGGKYMCLIVLLRTRCFAQHCPFIIKNMHRYVLKLLLKLSADATT